MSDEDVVMCECITDVKLLDRMNTVYEADFKDPRPTRTTVAVKGIIRRGAGHFIASRTSFRD
jgi:enamine deaminase RidA (YjgF/YER057c/UK114 family)